MIYCSQSTFNAMENLFNTIRNKYATASNDELYLSKIITYDAGPTLSRKQFDWYAIRSCMKWHHLIYYSQKSTRTNHLGRESVCVRDAITKTYRRIDDFIFLTFNNLSTKQATLLRKLWIKKNIEVRINDFWYDLTGQNNHYNKYI